MNAPKVTFNIENQSYSTSAPSKGVHCVAGITEMGPFADPSSLISSWPQFQRTFGGYIGTSDFPLLCKRALDRGAILRVSRVGHYTDITDKTSLDAVKASVANQARLTFSAALVTSNVINVSINGEAITPVTFATDNDTTLDSIATALQGLNTVAAAYVIPVTGTAGTLNRQIVVVTKTAALPTITAVVTLGASQASVAVSAITDICDNEGNVLFSLTPKYEGAAYNALYVKVETAYGSLFNLTIGMTGRSDMTETYKGITVENIVSPTFLKEIAQYSQLVDVTYYDLSALASGVAPLAGLYYFASGDDGTTPVAVDYVGDAGAGNGLYAFDGIDDALDICVPEKSDSTIHQAGSAYVAARKDMRYLAHLSNSNITAASYLSERNALNIDNYLVEFYGGGLKVTDPLTGVTKEISEMGDVIGAMSYSDLVANESFSCAGIQRGVVQNVLGVVRNFGAPARYSELNQMAERGINMVVQSDNLVYLNSMFTGAAANSKLSFGNIVKFLLFLQRTLRPTVRQYLNNPNDFPQWRKLFNEVKPTLDRMTKGEARMMYAYDWQGDQGITDISQMVINVPADVDNGKYKVKLFLKTISPMIDIQVDMVITTTAFEFQVQ